MKTPFVSHRRILSAALAAVVSLTALTGTALAQGRYYDNGRGNVPPPPPGASRYEERSRPDSRQDGRSYRYERQPAATVKRGSSYDRHDHNHGSRYDRGQRGHDHDYNRRVYLSRPRSSFTIVYGTGYAGQGYYYGAPDCAYHYEAPGVRYFRSRDDAYRAYPAYQQRGYSSGYDCHALQRALYSRGYYRGAIDGQYGPGCRDSVSRFQRDRGLRVTGVVSVDLLRLLGL